MGIFIHLNVSKQIRRSEWRKVYEESLKLVKAFPLYEKQKRIFLGEGMYCGVPTKEREWFGRIGWHTIGDSVTLQSAEDYFLPKDLLEEEPVVEERMLFDENGSDEGKLHSGYFGVKAAQSREDILLSLLPMYTDVGWEDERCHGCFELWGNKTQGENYHIYLLAIACMIEDRLGEKAVVYGDITRGQCVRAVELANRYLEEPIRLPCRCDPGRLYERVRRLPLGKQEVLPFFFGAYMGKKNAEFGKFVCEHFSKEELTEYWQRRFAGEHPDTLRYERVLHEYLTLGFGFEELCRLMCLTMQRGKGYERMFVERILQTEMHRKDKDCEDWLEIDPDREQPYGVYALLAQFAFAGARNQRVERFIPLSEIKSVLQACLIDRCDVEAVISEWLKKEEEREEALAQGDSSKQAASDRFKETLRAGKEPFTDSGEYEITTYRELAGYRDGDRIQPVLRDELLKYYQFYQSLTEESRFQELMNKDAKERGLFIIRHNESVLLMEEEWRRIFAEIRSNRESFGRYYPMVRVRIPSNEVAILVRALVLNDPLFWYCRKEAERSDR